MLVITQIGLKVFPLKNSFLFLVDYKKLIQLYIYFLQLNGNSFPGKEIK